MLSRICLFLLRWLLQKPLILVIRFILWIYLSTWDEEAAKEPNSGDHKKIIWEFRQLLKRVQD